MSIHVKIRFRLGVENLEDRQLLSGSGSLDTTFGTGGIVTTSLTSKGSDFATAVLLQPDGKLVAAGTGLARFNSNGTLDTSFGSGGKVTLTTRAEAAALYPAGTANAGKIVTAAATSSI